MKLIVLKTTGEVLACVSALSEVVYGEFSFQIGDALYGYRKALVEAVDSMHGAEAVGKQLTPSGDLVDFEAGPISLEALKLQRTMLLAEVAREREARQVKGKKYAFPDGQLGTIQTRDDRDLVNINGRVTAALVLQAQAVADPVLSFRDEENVTHVMTPVQMVAMGMAASAFVSETYTAKWAHDTAIAAWDGAQPYDISSGWPE